MKDLQELARLLTGQGPDHHPLWQRILWMIVGLSLCLGFGFLVSL